MKFENERGYRIRLTPEILAKLFVHENKEKWAIELTHGIPNNFKCIGMEYLSSRNEWQLVFATDELIEGSALIQFTPIFEVHYIGEYMLKKKVTQVIDKLFPLTDDLDASSIINNNRLKLELGLEGNE